MHKMLSILKCMKNSPSLTTRLRQFSSFNLDVIRDGNVIDGTKVADKLLEDTKKDVAGLIEQYGPEGRPTLAVVLVGERPDSQKYVSMKKKAAKKVGFKSVERVLPETCTQKELLDVVKGLNETETMDGILVQLPLPPQIDQTRILEAIDVDKDVDGFHPFNTGRLARIGEELRQNKECFLVSESRNAPCTPLGAITLLEQAGVEIAGKHAVVLGRSNIVGLPAALMLLHRNATVTMCHSQTKNIEEICRTGDIVVSALGKAELVKASWIKPGAAVIDVGINFKPDPSSPRGVKMCGDVDFEEARKVASAITPVPKGVGPMTVAMLMRNTLNNAKVRLSHRQRLEMRSSNDDYDDTRSPEQLVRKLSRPVSWKYDCE